MNPEQQRLVQQAKKSADAARLLLEQSYPEFAASRAYYAMFYIAEAVLFGEGLTFSKHGAVLAAFGKHFAKTGHAPIEFHQYLLEAFEVRQIGDYTTQQVGEAEAALQIMRAEQLIAWAEQSLNASSEIPDDLK